MHNSNNAISILCRLISYILYLATLLYVSKVPQVNAKYDVVTWNKIIHVIIGIHTIVICEARN